MKRLPQATITHRERILLALLAFLVFMLVPAVPAAAATIRGDDEVRIDKDISDDVYVFGGNLDISGDISGDLVAAGGNITVTGRVDGNIMATGGQITVNGPVTGTVRAGGGSIIINGRVGRDVLAGAGTLTLGPDSVVAGDLIAGVGLLRVDGVIGDDVRGDLGSADFAGEVGGDIRISVDTLTVLDSARVGGDIVYRSDRDADISTGAEVQGEIERKPAVKPAKPSPFLRLFYWLWSLIGMILTALAITWLFPDTFKSTKRALTEKTGATIGLGAVTLVLTPFAALLLIIFTIGLALPIALIALAVYTAAIYLGQIYAAAAIGNTLLKRENGLGAVLGVIGFGILRLIPYLGGFVTLILIIVGLGAMSLACWGSWRRPPETTATQSEEPAPATD